MIVAVILAGIGTIIAIPVTGALAWIFFVVLFSGSCIGIWLFNDPAFITSFFLGAGATSTQSDICNKCFSVVERTDNKICKCGGKYEPIENWKWVEDIEGKPNKTVAATSPK